MTYRSGPGARAVPRTSAVRSGGRTSPAIRVTAADADADGNALSETITHACTIA